MKRRHKIKKKGNNDGEIKKREHEIQIVKIPRLNNKKCGALVQHHSNEESGEREREHYATKAKSNIINQMASTKNEGEINKQKLFRLKYCLWKHLIFDSAAAACLFACRIYLDWDWPICSRCHHHHLPQRLVPFSHATTHFKRFQNGFWSRRAGGRWEDGVSLHLFGFRC